MKASIPESAAWPKDRSPVSANKSCQIGITIAKMRGVLSAYEMGRIGGQARAGQNRQPSLKPALQCRDERFGMGMQPSAQFQSAT